MNTSPAARWRPLLALLLLLGIPTLLAAAVAWPVWSLNAAYSERIAERERLLDRYARIAADSQALQAQVQHLERWQSASNLYLRGTTAALAAAELQRIVKQQAGGRGGRVLSTQTLASTQEGAFTRVALKVRLRGDMAALLHTLHGLESRRPLLFIDSLTVRALSTRRRDPRSGEMLDVIDLDVVLEVSGYLQGTA